MSFATRIAALAFTLVSCGNYVEQKSGGENSDLNVSLEAVDFSTVQSRIFEPHCVSCHQQYKSYSGVRRETNAILSAVAANRMPKAGGPLGDNLKRLLQAWVARGAPEKSGQSTTPDIVGIEPTWKSLNELVLIPRCLVCHNPNGQAKFLDLSTRQAVFDARNRVFGDGKKLADFDQPDASYLLEVVRDPVEPMPPIWSNIRRLNEDEIRALGEWIGYGLP